MKGPCMCGDTACGSCGPLQGHDPGYEEFLDDMDTLMTIDNKEDAHWEALECLIENMLNIKPLAYYLYAVSAIMRKKNMVEEHKLTAEDFKVINKELEAYPGKCPKHDEWPDSEIGCPSCYEEQLMEEARLAAEYKAEELKYGRYEEED